MPIYRVIATSIVVGLLTFLPAPAGAQTTPPWPDGCSIGLPLFIQNGLDRIFFAACTHHDFCWARCNPPGGPYLGLSHKFQCDGFFLAEMEAACAAWSVVLSYPGSGWSDSGAFLEDCSAVAATMATAVGVTPPGLSRYWQSQCQSGGRSSWTGLPAGFVDIGFKALSRRPSICSTGCDHDSVGDHTQRLDDHLGPLGSRLVSR